MIAQPVTPYVKGVSASILQYSGCPLGIIKSNADRLSLLVNDILDISRIETGRMRMAMHPIDLHSLVEVVVSNLYARREQEEKEIAVKVDIPSDLPEVLGDVDRLTQILTNLLDNAFNYTPAGGQITIAGVLETDRGVCVSVTDTGIGITPEDQSRIFDRFFRSDQPEVQEVSGTGLGLSIVNHLIEMHGGRLKVFSEGLGRGSTFSFTLSTADKVTKLDETDG